MRVRAFFAVAALCCLASEAAPHRGARVRAGARASLAAASFSDANVPSAVADDFVSCNRTAESFQAKCAAFLDNAAFFPTAARAAAFPFGYSRNLTAPRWCGMAWTLAKNCLDQVPPPSRAEPCEFFLTRAVDNLQPLASPAHFPDLLRPARKRVALVFWSGAFDESKKWAEASDGKMWVQDGTIEGRLLGMIAAYKWPDSEDASQTHCEKDAAAGRGWSAARTLKPWSVASAMFARRLQVGDSAAALLGAFSATNVFAKTEAAVIATKLAVANVASGAPKPLLALKLLRGLKYEGAAVDEAAACKKVLVVLCKAAHAAIKGLGKDAMLPMRCEAGCAVADGKRAPACATHTLVEATASKFSDACALGLGPVTAASALLAAG